MAEPQSTRPVFLYDNLTQSMNSSNSFKPRTMLHLRVFKDPTFQYKCLKVSGRELADIPRELFELYFLEYLALSPERESGLTFRLLTVPKEIGELKQLRILCLDTNELKRLPNEIGKLKNLERLVLSNNLLTSLPASFSDLQNLKHLHLANNYFNSIPTCVYSMLNLVFLDATDNKISKISQDIGALVGLESLLLLYNILETLPDAITKCIHLKNLWLGNNRLKSLPKKFGDLSKIDWEFHPNSANIDGNPLKHPPVEVCSQGPDAIRDYFKQNETPPMDYEDGSSADEGQFDHGFEDSMTSSSLHLSSDCLEVPPTDVNTPRKRMYSKISPLNKKKK